MTTLIGVDHAFGVLASGCCRFWRCWDFPAAAAATLPGASADTIASVAGIIGASCRPSPASRRCPKLVAGTTAITIQFDLNRNIDAAALDVHPR
jgi:hypothetical protein